MPRWPATQTRLNLTTFEEPPMKRKTLVRLAGHVGGRGRIILMLRYEMDCAYGAFGRSMGAYLWGGISLAPMRKVSVPRSLRHRLGRYVEELRTGGRRRKDRRKHNRRWMPEQDCDC